MKRIFLLLVSLTFLSVLSAHGSPIAKPVPPRSCVPLVDWQFVEESKPAEGGGQIAPPRADADWKRVCVPHVFRQSGIPDDSVGWYRTTLRPKDSDRGQSFYLFLEGAASIKDVFINGQPVGKHRGAFSRSSFNLTPALRFGQANTLDVRVSNTGEETRDCFSRSTLYYVNGGMFRPAWLVKTGAVHVFPEMGSTGVYLTPKNVSDAKADLRIQALASNTLPQKASVQMKASITDPKGRLCGTFEQTRFLAAGETATLETTGKIKAPLLWNLGQPNLYTAKIQLLVEGKVTDEVVEKTGLRTIEWKNDRFFLNGREVQFRGVCKHSQTEYEWNAVDDDETRREWQSMADMGVNAARLAHYPHRALEYDIADAAGIAVWAENGYAGQAWNHPGNEEKTVTPDGEKLTREMVRQNWNHPSILFWSAGNETIPEVVSHYAEVIRSEKDPSRLVTYAANGPLPEKLDFVARNTYDGWYGSHYAGFAELPQNALISETGCGDWITHHIPYGEIQWKVDQFEPEEYAGIFTEFRLQTVFKNDAANRPMFFWWNFREFYDKKFKSNRNTKGLMTLAGMPKDLYFLFASFMAPSKPVLHLCGKQFFLRAFAPDNGIKAYSNAMELRLKLNGIAQEPMKNGDYRLPDSVAKDKKGNITGTVPGIPVSNVFFWKNALQPGRNLIEVSDDRGNTESTVVYQKPAEGCWPEDPHAIVQALKSSNPENRAWLIERPIAPQWPFYTEVDGSSDNTFDLIPKKIEGAAWIATRRLSDPKFKTDLSFRINASSKGATVHVLFSTGRYPIVTLKPTDQAIAETAGKMRSSLSKAGFQAVDADVVWRDHDLNRAQAELWSRTFQPGEEVCIPGETLDYVILLGGR